MTEQIKSVIYARVSPTTHIKTTNDIHQSIEESLIMCRRDAEHEGNIIIKEYVDEYVTGKSVSFMKNFKLMLEDANKGLFKRVYCRRVNRFGRNRNDMIRAEIQLSELGVSLKFVESGIDTAKPLGKSLMALYSEIAQMDREEILENTRIGRERIKNGGLTKSGKPWGHPKKDVNVKAIRSLRLLPIKDRPTWKQLETDYKVSRIVMLRRLKEAGYWDETKGSIK